MVDTTTALFVVLGTLGVVALCGVGYLVIRKWLLSDADLVEFVSDIERQREARSHAPSPDSSAAESEPQPVEDERRSQDEQE